MLLKQGRSFCVEGLVCSQSRSNMRKEVSLLHAMVMLPDVILKWVTMAVMMSTME